LGGLDQPCGQTETAPGAGAAAITVSIPAALQACGSSGDDSGTPDSGGKFGSTSGGSGGTAARRRVARMQVV